MKTVIIENRAVLNGLRGRVLGEAVYWEDRLLVGEGQIINDTIIEFLSRRKISEVIVKEPWELSDAERRDIIEKSYGEALAAGRKAVKAATTSKGIDLGVCERCVASARDAILVDRDTTIDVMRLLDEDEYLFVHSVNVSVLSMIIGTIIGLDEDEIRDLGIAGLLHDIGMLQVSDEIRNKPGPLTAAELAEVRKHPSLAASILIKKKDLSVEILNGIYQHHERHDGTGYPEGLTGEDIWLYAKIIAVADCYESITHARPYRAPVPPHVAIRAMLPLSESQFDPEVTRAFLKFMPLFPVGSRLELNTGDQCVVRSATGNVFRPRVEITEKSSRFSPGTVIDLSDPGSFLVYVMGIVETEQSSEDAG